MNVPSLSSSVPTQQASTARATDGDYKVKSAATAQTKDSDGDYKAAKPPAPAAASSTTSVQGALLGLSKGGA